MLEEVLVGYGQPYFAAMVFEIVAQEVGDGENGLFPGGFDGLSGERGVITELHLHFFFKDRTFG